MPCAIFDMQLHILYVANSIFSIDCVFFRVEKSLFQSPVVKLKANCQKNVFQSALTDIAIDNSHVPAYFH